MSHDIPWYPHEAYPSSGYETRNSAPVLIGALDQTSNQALLAYQQSSTQISNPAAVTVSRCHGCPFSFFCLFQHPRNAESKKIFTGTEASNFLSFLLTRVLLGRKPTLLVEKGKSLDNPA